LDTLLSLMLGVSLSAACGFRVFVPLLVMSVASLSGDLTLASGFEWIGTPQAFAMFAVASGLEVGGYYIPWLDNLLDTVAAPAAIVAGTIVTASSVSELSPLLQWTLAVVAGGGAAGLTQSLTSITRFASTATTGGLANPLVSTMELGSAVVLSSLALTLPLLGGILVLGLLLFALQKLVRLFKKRSSLKPSSPAQ
jgi:Domain of unknown function (DUF4126)